MKRLFGILAFLFFNIALSNGQNAISYVAIGTNWNYLAANRPVNDFIASYNSYFSSLLSQQFDPIRSSGHGYNVALMWVGPNIMVPMRMGVQYYSGSSEAMFHTGYGRELSIYDTDLYVNFGVNGVIRDHLYVGAVLFEMDGKFTRMSSEVIYPDGSRSMDNQYSLNGSFWLSDYAWYYSFGPELGVKFKSLLGYISFKKQLGGGDGVLYDYMLERSFPADYEAYATGQGSAGLQAFPLPGWVISFNFNFLLQLYDE